LVEAVDKYPPLKHWGWIVRLNLIEENGQFG
jgi:hypothetical protein